MSRATLTTGAERDVPLAMVAATTTWFTMLSWRGFSATWGEYLGPLLVVALTVSSGGVAVRAAPMPRRAGVAVHVLLVMVVVWLILGGSWSHPFASSDDIGLAIRNGFVSEWRYTAPVPESAASIAPAMIVCGSAALLLVDVLACWLRRVGLAGLPLLAVYSAPVIGFHGAVAWLVFVLGAIGYLVMLFIQESARVLRWGRPLDAAAETEVPSGFGEGTSARRAAAGTVGGAAVVLAVVVPLFIPDLHLDRHDLFSAAGGGGTVKLNNPTASMLLELHQTSDVPLLRIRTSNPDPSYLRLAVLRQFDGVRWTTGTRPDVTDHAADGPIPTEEGLSPTVASSDYEYTVQVSNNYYSRWLPTQFPVSSVVVAGDWLYDPSTTDFFAGDPETNVEGITYEMTAALPQITPHALMTAPSAPPDIRSAYLTLPPALPAKVWNLAVRVTSGLTNPYRMAVRLQTWFRSTGGFHYSLDAHYGSSENALVHFLTRGHGGRVGYCQQFASAYAVMARILNIPARVAVGFLHPTRAPDGDWIYSSHDLHTWPELYFQGSGWVRFEPTPATRARTTPPWTRTAGANHTSKDTHSHRRTGGDHISPSTHPTQTQHRVTTPTHTTASSPSPFPWAALGETLGGLAAAAALVLVPGAVRRSRRARRLAGGAEDAWAELRDTAVDLGVSWPSGRSPHETGESLTRWFGPASDTALPVRPPRGQGLAPAAESAMARIVLTLEQVRYARSASDVPGALAEDARTCIEALERGSTRRTLRRARWAPRSVFAGRAAPTSAAPPPEPEPVTRSEGIDHLS
jgi:transglutaminase-like putative cysteine protease